MILLWLFESNEDELEEVDPSNVILLDDRRKTVKVQMATEEELEVVEEIETAG